MELSRGTAKATRFIRLRKQEIVGTESAEQIDVFAAKRNQASPERFAQARRRNTYWGYSHFSFAKAGMPSFCLFFHSLKDSV
jgi:hypothetical protein